MNKKTICYCKDVCEREIVEAIHNGATTLEKIQETTGACTGNQCKKLNPSGHCCAIVILDIIERETGINPSLQHSCCN
jgi:NAD(P)H-nitrite reductase large subunit